MAITQIISKTHAVGVAPTERDEARFLLPTPPDMGQREMTAEEDVIEFSSSNAPNIVIKLAMMIEPRHGASAGASPRMLAIPRQSSREGAGQMTEAEPMQWDRFSDRARRWVEAQIEEFFGAYPAWGEIALLKAGNLDLRLFVRIRAGDSFATGTIDRLTDTMNKAARGELNPEDFRNRGWGGSKKPQAKDADRGSSSSRRRST